LICISPTASTWRRDAADLFHTLAVPFLTR
jgi:hypothetical protein